MRILQSFLKFGKTLLHLVSKSRFCGVVICGVPGGEKERNEQNTRQQFERSVYQGNIQKCQQITSFIQNWGEFTLVKDEKQKTDKELATDIYHIGYTEKKRHMQTHSTLMDTKGKKKNARLQLQHSKCANLSEVPLSYFASCSELLVFCGHWVP